MAGTNAAYKAREFEAQGDDNVFFSTVANWIDNAPDAHCLSWIAARCEERAAGMRSRRLGGKYREIASLLRREVAACPA